MARSNSVVILVKELKGYNLLSLSGIFVRLVRLNTPSPDVSHE